ncbi:MAG TPA: ABC transporter ATP-binding protein, partial [Gemmatimonadaceae bacterium]|nr:ABC transporter ATP-binding protein [Gemmatimonadaceae bacterium]
LVGLWIGKLIIDVAVAARTHTPQWHRLWTLVACEVGVVILNSLLGRLATLVESLLGDLFTNRVSIMIMQHAATLDLAQFEDPTFYDLLERARQQSGARLSLLSSLVGTAQNVLTLVGLSGALLAYNGWLLLLLLVALLPSFLGETHYSRRAYSLFFSRTQERRQLEYLRYVAASDRLAKEVQMFALAPWLIERFRALSQQFYTENMQLAVRRTIVTATLPLISTAAYYTAYALILRDTMRGLITIGTLTFLAGSFSRSRDLLQGLLGTVRDIYDQTLYLRDLFLFFDLRPRICAPPRPILVNVPIAHGFRFEDVGFQYPGSERWAIRHVSFSLHAGERLALVGENGAGKTTLTKLLARLYDPVEGRILLDGVDLREYDIASLRRAIGVIFQDFARYDMRFDENIGVGQIDVAQSYFNGDASHHRETPITAAAEKSLAVSLLSRLPKGYQQMLGRRFHTGVDLSGGEWQKVALARAYMREAQVLILDEPTAALDARAEFEVFRRFTDLTSGRTAILISHRFSTVRVADRIIVLRGGQITDQGTHDELMTQPGLYQELFMMQAAGYR